MASQLNAHEFEQVMGVGDGQGSLACYSPWGHKESDTTEQLNNNLRSARWVLWSLYLVQNMPQLGMHMLIFSPMQFLYILLLEERCVGMPALQRKGPRSHPVSERPQKVQLRKKHCVFPGVSLSLEFRVISTFWLWGVQLLKDRKSKPRQVDLPASPSRPIRDKWPWPAWGKHQTRRESSLFGLDFALDC